MDPYMVMFVLFGVLIVLLVMGMRIAFAMLVTGFIGLFFLLDMPQPEMASKQLWIFSYSYVLTTIPLFVFMAEILMRCGITKDGYDNIRKTLGRLCGAEAYTTVLLCTAFSALSGSSVANAAAIGTVSIPEMRRRGYADRISLGMVAAGGTLGILLPPSSSLIIYGSLTGESVGKMFMAGLIPGLLLSLSYLVIVFIWSHTKRKDFPAIEDSTTFREKIRSFMELLPPGSLIIVILGGIYIGIFTPTEAAGVGASASMVYVLAKRRLTWRLFKESLEGAIKTTCMIMLIILGASLITYVLGFCGATDAIVEAVVESGVGYWPLMILIIIFYMVTGCLVESTSLIVLTVPIFNSLMLALGIDPIWFAIFMVVNIEMGLITPPVGLNLFIIQGIAGQRAFGTVVKGVLPFLLAQIILLIMLIAWPQLALWLPETM